MTIAVANEFEAGRHHVQETKDTQEGWDRKKSTLGNVG